MELNRGRQEGTSPAGKTPNSQSIHLPTPSCHRVLDRPVGNRGPSGANSWSVGNVHFHRSPVHRKFQRRRPKGDFQVENGLLATDTQGQYTLDFPETALRFGLIDKTELRLSAPDYFQALQGGTTVPSGFGDIAIGVKQQLGSTSGHFKLSFILFLSLPTGAKDVSSHGYDPGLQLPWSHPISENWTLSGQGAFYWPTQADKRNFSGQFTFALNRQLTKPWDTFIEYAGDFPQRGGSRQLLHFGSAYKLAPRHQIDFHIAAGLSRAAPDMFVGLGYSFLLRIGK